MAATRGRAKHKMATIEDSCKHICTHKRKGMGKIATRDCDQMGCLGRPVQKNNICLVIPDHFKDRKIWSKKRPVEILTFLEEWSEPTVLAVCMV